MTADTAVSATVDCPDCQGHGEVLDSRDYFGNHDTKTCGRCAGTGEVPAPQTAGAQPDSPTLLEPARPGHTCTCGNRRHVTVIPHVGPLCRRCRGRLAALVSIRRAAR